MATAETVAATAIINTVILAEIVVLFVVAEFVFSIFSAARVFSFIFSVAVLIFVLDVDILGIVFSVVFVLSMAFVSRVVICSARIVMHTTIITRYSGNLHAQSCEVPL